MIKKFKHKVMGLLDQSKKTITTDEVKIGLTKQELEILLGTLKNSNFKGEVVEILYDLVLKLQNNYLLFPQNNDK